MIVHSLRDAVVAAARLIECPICKEVPPHWLAKFARADQCFCYYNICRAGRGRYADPCRNAVRPKNCPHRYCMDCFRKCFQDKQNKPCATCRTPILSVSKRGFTQDILFERVAEIVPGIRDKQSDDDIDLEAMMRFQMEQTQKLRAQAQQLRAEQGIGAHVRRSGRGSMHSSRPEVEPSVSPRGRREVLVSRVDRDQAVPQDVGRIGPANSRAQDGGTKRGSDGLSGSPSLKRLRTVQSEASFESTDKPFLGDRGNAVAGDPRNRHSAPCHRPALGQITSVSAASAQAPVARHLLPSSRQLSVMTPRHRLVEFFVYLTNGRQPRAVTLPWDYPAIGIADLCLKAGLIDHVKGKLVLLGSDEGEQDVTSWSAGQVAEQCHHSIRVRLS